MAKYPEGTISPSGKGIVKGGQWVPYEGKVDTVTNPAGPPQIGGYLGRKETMPYTGREAVELPTSMNGLLPEEESRLANIPKGSISPGVAKVLGGAGSVLGAGLGALQTIAHPLTWAVDKAIRQPLNKIPSMAKPLVLPESGNEVMAGQHTGDFPKEYSKENITYPPPSEIAAFGAEMGVMPAYFRGVGKLAKGLGRGLGILKTAPGAPKMGAGIGDALDSPEILSKPPSAAMSERLLGQQASELGVPLAAEDASKVAGIEGVVEEALFGSRSMRQHAPGMGNITPEPPSPFTGTNIPRERLGTTVSQLKRQATDPSRINRMINPPVGPPVAPHEVPPAAGSIRYGKGMGNLNLPPERYHGAVPQERLGTEFARTKSQFRQSTKEQFMQNYIAEITKIGQILGK